MLIIQIKKNQKSHYDGCKNLALFFLKSNIKKFVQIGSSIEYGKTHSPQKENNQNKQKPILFMEIRNY